MMKKIFLFFLFVFSLGLNFLKDGEAGLVKIEDHRSNPKLKTPFQNYTLNMSSSPTGSGTPSALNMREVAQELIKEAEGLQDKGEQGEAEMLKAMAEGLQAIAERGEQILGQHRAARVLQKIAKAAEVKAAQILQEDQDHTLDISSKDTEYTPEPETLSNTEQADDESISSNMSSSSTGSGIPSDLKAQEVPQKGGHVIKEAKQGVVLNLAQATEEIEQELQRKARVAQLKSHPISISSDLTDTDSESER